MDALIRKIIIPVDFSTASEHAARFGSTLARSLGAQVYLVHVIEQAARTAAHLSDVSAARQQRYRDARADMECLAQRLCGGAQVTTEIRTGLIADAIAAAVVAYGADLVVMATHGRTGIPHLLLGSVAEEVIRTATCPVLVIRESGQVRVHSAAAHPAPHRLAHSA